MGDVISLPILASILPQCPLLDPTRCMGKTLPTPSSKWGGASFSLPPSLMSLLGTTLPFLQYGGLFTEGALPTSLPLLPLQATHPFRGSLLVPLLPPPCKHLSCPGGGGIFQAKSLQSKQPSLQIPQSSSSVGPGKESSAWKQMGLSLARKTGVNM